MTKPSESITAAADLIEAYGSPKACCLMWGTVLAFALWIATDPTRLVIVAVLMSRLRPKHNLLAYWLGGLAAGVVPGIGVFGLALALHNSAAAGYGRCEVHGSPALRAGISRSPSVRSRC